MDTKKSLLTGSLVLFMGGLALAGFLYVNFVSFVIVKNGLQLSGWPVTKLSFERNLKVTMESISNIPFAFGTISFKKVSFTVVKPPIRELLSGNFEIANFEASQASFFPDPGIQKAAFALTGNPLKAFEKVKIKSVRFEAGDVAINGVAAVYGRLPLSIADSRVSRSSATGEITLTIGPPTGQALCPGTGKLNLTKSSIKFACQNPGINVSIEIQADGSTQYATEGSQTYYRTLAKALGAQKLWLELQGKTELDFSKGKAGPSGQHGFQVRGKMERGGQVYEFGTYNPQAPTDQNWRSLMSDINSQTSAYIVMNSRTSRAVEIMLVEMPHDARIPPLDLAVGGLREPKKYDFQANAAYYIINRATTRPVAFGRTSPKTLTKDFEQVAALRMPSSEKRMVVGYSRNRMVKITEAEIGDTVMHPRTGQVFCSKPFGILDVQGCLPIQTPKLSLPQDKGEVQNSKLIEFSNRLHAAPSVDLYRIVSDLQLSEPQVSKRHGSEAHFDAMALDTRRNRILLVTNNPKDVPLPPSMPFLIFELNTSRFNEVAPRFPTDLEHLSVAYSELDDTYISLVKPIPDRAGTSLKLVRFRADNFETISISDPPAEMTPILTGSPSGVQLMSLGANVFVRPKEAGPALFALNPRARTWNQGRVEMDASLTSPVSPPAAPDGAPASAQKRIPAAVKK